MPPRLSEGSGQMERFFGGNPALILLRLVILSLIVGVVLAALGFSPYDLLQNIRDLVQRIYDMGFTAVEKAFRYFLLGAVIVFPVWVVMRVFKMLGRETTNGMAETGHGNREA
jgi:cell division protein FtsL